MPQAINPMCRVRGCKHRQPCPKHSRQRRSPDTRPSSYERGYGGAAWTKTRMRVIWRDQACCFCGGPVIGQDNKPLKGATVHHVIPKRKGGTDDESNLAACHSSCHREHHGRDRGLKDER